LLVVVANPPTEIITPPKLWVLVLVPLTMAMLDPSGARLKVSPEAVITPPLVRVSPPITNSVAWLAVHVETPITSIDVVTAIGTSVVAIAWVMPLITIAFPDTGRINVVGEADPEPERTIVPPGLSVELPIMKFDDKSPVIVELPAGRWVHSPTKEFERRVRAPGEQGENLPIRMLERLCLMALR